MNKPGWPYRFLRTAYLRMLDLVTKKNGVLVQVNDFKFRVPGRFSRYYPRKYEEENFKFLNKAFKPGILGIDVGAHLGIYSIRMAQLGARKVHSFEPTPSTTAILEKIISLNHFKGEVLIHNEAIGKHSGEANFHINFPIDDRDKMSVSEANSLKYIDHGSQIVKKAQPVNLISLDDFLKDQPSDQLFLKIDAEGSELDILKGAINTFKTRKPAGIVSIHNFTYADRKTELLNLWELMIELGINPMFENRPVDRAGLLALEKMDIFDLQFSVH